MDLRITPELVTELHDATERGVRADEVGIVLTDEGWRVHTWIDRVAWPVAMTGADVDGFCSGDLDVAFDAEIAEALASDTPGHVVDEDGAVREPGEDEQPAVVTAVVRLTDRDPETGDYVHDEAEGVDSGADTWWFDMNTARQIIDSADREFNEGRTTELWVTAGGRYVLRTWTRFAGEADGAWSEVPVELAVDMVYTAEPDRVAEALPATLAAAWHLARAAEQIEAPRLAPDDPAVMEGRARRRENEAAEVFAAARVLTDLSRYRLTPDLRNQRARAGRVVIRAYGGNVSAAARRLDVADSTLHNITNEPKDH